MAIRPSVGLKGVFLLKAPFDSKVDPAVSYTVDAVRTFGDIEREGVDVNATYYAPYGIAQSEFDKDRRENQVIVVLVSDHKEPVHVPGSYIAAIPSADAVPYQRVVLTADLGLLPEHLDLSYGIKQVNQVLKDVLGVNAVVVENVAPHKGVVNAADHSAATANREAAKSHSGTDFSRILKLEADLAASRARAKIFEDLLRKYGHVKS